MVWKTCCSSAEHDLGQHFGAAHQGQRQAAGLVELDIAGLDRRGIDHGMGLIRNAIIRAVSTAAPARKVRYRNRRKKASWSVWVRSER